jgi:polyhydroxyalkanoate depolymerase
MEASVMSLFPWMVTGMERFKAVAEAQMVLSDMTAKTITSGADLIRQSANWPAAEAFPAISGFLEANRDAMAMMLDAGQSQALDALKQFHAERAADVDFLSLFIDPPPRQDWETAYAETNILMDLPGLRLIDFSTPGPHAIGNYTVVFAPRAGHHSNIAEKTALFLRDQGLTRMAVVEQKCASDIPLMVDGQLHNEDFTGQVAQYKTILEFLKNKAAVPSHLVAVCQPGPLLMATLILNPELGKTYGSAGSPMHTEGERGFLTDFSRLMGENYIDTLIDVFSGTVPEGDAGAGRRVYDGRLQVLGFYYLGVDAHMKNFRKYYEDLKNNNTEAADRQKEFYQWYNWTHHFPAEFIRDTYKKIFVNNELIHGTLTIGDKTVSIKNYPKNVPIWSLGGSKDDIVPPLQANGHLDLIEGMPAENKLPLVAEAGHMGLFRSSKVLKNFYTQVAAFLLKHSDPDRSHKPDGQDK